MAENDSSQEKTEEPTERRLSKSREEGQVARSKELNTFVVLISGALALLVFGTTIGKGLMGILRHQFVLDRQAMFDTKQPLIQLGVAAQEAAMLLAPFMFILLVASIVGPIGLGGWLVSGKALAPKMSRISPIKGIKRMFSLNSLMELAKALAKTVVIGGIAVVIFVNVIPDLRSLASESVETSIIHAIEIVAWSFVFLASSLLLIAAVDVPFQIYNHQKNLRMTKQEVKDEYKDTEGKPEVKQRIRQVQYEMSKLRMLEEVPKADVVITNPTHYSVALKYDGKSMGAPIVVAKGIDHLAIKIREIAKEHGIERVESPPLTRAIYYHSDVGQEIPAPLYLAVAQVLAYVFQIRRYRKGYGQKPEQLPDFEIPSDLRHDEN